jgi:two-component system, NtrC family, response regulator HupR/HoxA
MSQVLDVMDRLEQRPYKTNVVLLGPPGTGKDGLARALHGLMAPGTPLVRLDVSGLSESEAAEVLCGAGRTPGAAEQADGGYLLIEELASLPIRAQGDLLRLLKAGKIQRVDASAPAKNRVQVNAIAISDRNLGNEVAAGRLRHDLYYRLARIVLSLPPLRERIDDVAAAAIWMGNRILRNAAIPLVLRGTEDFTSSTEQERLRSIELSKEALSALRKHDWPGNFRELEAVMERALLLYRSGTRLDAEAVDSALSVTI